MRGLIGKSFGLWYIVSPSASCLIDRKQRDISVRNVSIGVLSQRIPLVSPMKHEKTLLVRIYFCLNDTHDGRSISVRLMCLQSLVLANTFGLADKIQKVSVGKKIDLSW